MNTTIIKTDTATQKEVLARCEAATTPLRPVVCFNDEADNTIISGIPTDDALRMLDGLTYEVIANK